MAHQDKNLKAFIRLDGKNRPVSGTTVLRLIKPKVGNWQEVITYLCTSSTTTTSTTVAVFTGIPQIFKNHGVSTISLSCATNTETVTYYSRTPILTGSGYFNIVIYSDSACTLPIDGDNQWWLHGLTNTSMFIDDTGSIKNWAVCP
jgi:hypothetical protein